MHGHGDVVPLPVVSYAIVDEGALIPSAVEDKSAQHYGFNAGSEWENATAGEGDANGGRYVRWLQPMEEELARQVEYDMDEQDQLWLDGINSDRKRDGEKPVSMESFEIIFDKIEKEWFDLSKRIPKKQSNLPGEDSKCAICDDGECENSNAIVFCDGCNLAVHQDCYGVPYIPEGQWLCRKCTVSPDKPVSCVLCPNSYGAFKQTTTAQWAHLLCAIWIPDTGVSNTVYMEPIDGVENISKNRWKLVCYHCKKRVGACIQCANRNCFTAFHVTCARERGLELQMKQNGERGELRAFCEKHSTNFVAPEAKIVPESAQDPSKSSGSSIILKRTSSGGQKFVLKHKSSKSARAYKKSYTSGPPLVPAFIFNRVVEYTKKLKFVKRPHFINQVCRYWSLKREARRGAPLLKRLHLEPWTASATSRQQTDAEKAKKLELIRHLRTDLEKVRMLTELVRKRERKKLERVQVFKSVMDDHIFSKTKIMRDVLTRIAALDKGRVFAQPVSRLAAPTYHDVIKHPMDWTTMGEKLDRHEYLAAQDFLNDFDLVINNAREFNLPENGVHKLAVKVHSDAQPILAELTSLDDADSDATKRAAELVGSLFPEYLDELFDYKYYPPEPERELSAGAEAGELVAVTTQDKGKGKEIIPRIRIRNRKRAAPAGLGDGTRSLRSGVEGESGEPSVIPSTASLPSEQFPPDQEHALKKARRDRSAPTTAPTPAHLIEIEPRDTFLHFESGWILPEGQSRRRKSVAYSDGSAHNPVASTSQRPIEPTVIEPPQPEPTPTRKLKVTFTAPSPIPSAPNPPPPPPLEPDPVEPFTSPKRSHKKLTPKEKKEKDRDRLRETRKGKQKAVDPTENESALPATLNVSHLLPAYEDTTQPEPPDEGDPGEPLSDEGADAMDVDIPAEPKIVTSARETKKAKETARNEARNAKRREERSRKKAEAENPAPSQVTSAVAPVAEQVPLTIEIVNAKQAEKVLTAKDVGMEPEGGSKTAHLAWWRARRAELEPSVRVTSSDQVPDGSLLYKHNVSSFQLKSLFAGTLVWVRFAGSPLWPAEIADPDDEDTPPGLRALRPVKDGPHALVMYFDDAGSWGWTSLKDLFLLGENSAWDEQVCLSRTAIELKKRKGGGQSVQMMENKLVRTHA
ncbi:NuA3 HAT complex component NTO1, partial [Phenoliferia sp. Uapishka_3]